MDKFETRTFVASEQNLAYIFEPVPSPNINGKTVNHYLVKTPDFKSKSQFKPLIVWGESLTVEIPYEWADLIGRATLWKIPVRRVLDGATISVRSGIYEGRDRFGNVISGMSLLAVHVQNDEPTEEAIEFVNQQIAERKGWFNADE